MRKSPPRGEVQIPDFEIWHNPRCSKSRATLKILEDSGADVWVRRYLDNPPGVGELTDVIERLGIEPIELVRRKEAEAREIGLDEGEHDAPAVLEAMVRHPILIERPVVLAQDGRAVIGRPPEKVRELLD